MHSRNAKAQHHSWLICRWKTPCRLSSYNQAVLNYGSPTFTTDRHGNSTGALNTTSGTIFLSNDQSGNFKCQFPFTFSAWIKSNALGARNPIFMNEDHGSSYSGVWINLLQTGEVIASIGNGGAPGETSRKCSNNYATCCRKLVPHCCSL